MSTNSVLVEVRPLPIDKWHGKKGKDSFGQPKEIEVLYDPKTGKYATGMTPEVAAKLSKEMGVDLSDTFNPIEPHSYWSTKPASIKLPIHTTFFDPNKPAELVKIYNMKASKFVANSMKEYDDGKWPHATHVLFDQTEDVNMKATKIAIKRECTLIVSKMSDADKINMVQILGEKSVRGRSTDFINVEIDEVIESKPAEFLRYAKMGREEVYIRASILEAIMKNILTKEASAVYYMGELIGYDYETTVEWFKNPQNSKMKIAILEKLTQ